MNILKSINYSDEELLEYAQSLSLNEGDIKDKLLHWEFGPIMHMSMKKDANNYLFSDEAVPYHWDGAFFKAPKKLIFHCVESRGNGGETLFVDTTKVWNSLTDSEKNLMSKVRLTYKTQKLSYYGGEFTSDLISHHPETNASIIRLAEKVETKLNPVELIIDGISKKEGNELYDYLIGKFYDPHYMYEHHWEKGDLLVCDNFTYLHGRRELRENTTRAFKRIQVL